MNCLLQDRINTLAVLLASNETQHIQDLQKRATAHKYKLNEILNFVGEHERQQPIKCPRCYNRHTATLNFDNLCNGCVAILTKYFQQHESYSPIIANLAARGLKPEDNPEWGNA